MYSSNLKHFLLQSAALCGVVILICLGVERLYTSLYTSNDDPHYQLFPHAEKAEKYQIVKVGNSHAQDGITFVGYKLRALNLAGVAQRFSYDLVQLKQHAQEIEPGAVILIDASHLSFSHRTADQHDGLQYNYYTSVSPFLIPHLKVADYLQIKVFPFLRAGQKLRQAYGEAVQKRISEEERWEEPVQEKPAPQPKEAPAQRRRTVQVQTVSGDQLFLNVEALSLELATPSALAHNSYTDNLDFIFNKWYHTDEFGEQYFERNRKDLASLIRYCLKKRWRPVVITIPVAEVLEEGLLDDYKQKYLYDHLAQTDLQGVEYIDFTQRKDFIKNLNFFSNADHLNPDGARVFSYLLLQELIQRGYVPPEADGYNYDPLYKTVTLE